MKTSHGIHPILAGLALLCLLALLSVPLQASADSGGFPTPTHTPTFTPIPSLTPTPTLTPVPTLAPTSALLAPATATPLVLDVTPEVSAAERQPISGYSIGGLLCWPFAVGLIVIVVLVASVFLRPTPP